MTNFSTMPIGAPLDAAAVLKRFHIRADKSLGQNFLQDVSALENIVLAAEIQEDDCVLEIGPGLGSLTRYLAVSAKEVTAIELDPDMLPPLRAVLTPYQNVRVVHGDILKTAVSELIHKPIIWWLPTSLITSPPQSFGTCLKATPRCARAALC